MSWPDDMRFLHFQQGGHVALAVDRGEGFRARFEDGPHYPGDVSALVRMAAARRAHQRYVAPRLAGRSRRRRVPAPCARPDKIVCLRLNYKSRSRQLALPPPFNAANAVSNVWPFGLPQPVHASHPLAALKAPLLPLVMSWNAFLPMP